MNIILCIVTAVILPYLICGVNPAIAVTKILTGKDIRAMGSGNAGLTNTIRSVGKPAAAAVLVIDIAKGFIAVYAVRIIALKLFGTDLYAAGAGFYYINFIAAAAAALGHAFPLWYNFKGGKSVLVTFSVTLAIEWQSALILFGLFLLVLLISGYVSLGSVIAGGLYPVGVYIVSRFMYASPTAVLDGFFSIFLAALLVIKHKDNIKRLIDGAEKKMLRSASAGKAAAPKKEKV